MHLDLVVPAHNEERRIASTIASYLGGLGADDRILVALDRCTDHTADVVTEAAAGDPRVEIHDYPKLGKGGVLMETFRRCRAEAVGFVDADGSTPPSELLRLLAVVERTGVDGAIAGRRHSSAVLPTERSPLRRLTSAGFAMGVQALFGLPFSDTQCGAKVLRRKVVEDCLPLLSSRDLLFDVDLLVTATRLGAKVVEVPTVWIDCEGSRLDVMKDSRRMAMSSLRLWLHHRILPVPVPAPESLVSQSPEPGVVIELQEHLEPPVRLITEAYELEPRKAANAQS